MVSYISQITYKTQVKSSRVSQSARLDGVLNTARHCDTHTQVSGPYSRFKKKQKKNSVAVESAEWSGGVSACLYRNRALRHQDQSLVAFLPKWKRSTLQFRNISSVHNGRVGELRPSSFPVQAFKQQQFHAGWGIMSSTVLQYFNKFTQGACVHESPPGDMALSFT